MITKIHLSISQQSSEGTITFKLVPSFGKGGSRESKVRVRALFNYNSSEDPYIPCKEAGLDFKKGDVLHIVSQDDAYWQVFYHFYLPIIIKRILTLAFLCLGGKLEEKATE